MMLLQNIRGRVGAAIGAGLAAVCFLGFGALFAFVLSPQQAMEWRRIEGLPELDAAAYAGTTIGDEVALTGTLTDNATQGSEGLVAYVREQWDVKPANKSDESTSNDKPEGSWDIVETYVPVLTIAINGGKVKTIAVSSANLGGNMHETAIKQGTGSERAAHNGQQLPEGSTRMRGFSNGDVVTVVGHKASTGDVTPNRIFGGDRVQLVENIRSGAQMLFAVGVGMMICSPIVLIMGVLGALFGRRSKATVG